MENIDFIECSPVQEEYQRECLLKFYLKELLADIRIFLTGFHA